MARRQREPLGRGERVKLRGRPPVGVLRDFNPGTQWARVEWDAGDGPQICHLQELEREPA